MSGPARLAGKRVWVTGAGRGIGGTVADAFVAEGAAVVGIDQEFGTAAAGIDARACDLGQAEAIDRLCDALLDAGHEPDVLVHAAGVLRVGGIEQLTHADWSACMAINAGAAFHLLRRLTPVFRRRRAGSIVAVASNAAHVPRVGMAAYGASKAALASLVRSVGLELAPLGVRCNLVSPGSTDTPMLRGIAADGQDAVALAVAGDPGRFRLAIPLGKVAAPSDIAAAILFLASDQAGQITLHDLVVDGGAALGA
ncbi:2,3-dihydro-2,3-dihydroxybenzoate dehydrogenase [Sphingomonas sp. RHCKR7]|uniref:2,3-dihydro-2,3-dihydroxybenzoate dehydrogenase n=1 Tax=Sphingomonas folli TaxID=2862497 RepID=UPI001CA4885D|nr:2,3-dihydro-2,3-dihydroxybenzoate dehydrogenase [Sphingomonas folli]MBW6528622.1 2,3-dihydro-2,3-dihydroxybenzoate dehydrogenase [Sphingomonas folli]